MTERALLPGDIETARKVLARLCDHGLVSMSIPVRQTDEDLALSRVIECAASAKSSFQHWVDEQEGNGPDAPSVGGKEGDAHAITLEALELVAMQPATRGVYLLDQQDMDFVKRAVKALKEQA